MKLRTAFVILVIVLVAAMFTPAQAQFQTVTIVGSGGKTIVCQVHKGLTGPILICP